MDFDRVKEAYNLNDSPHYTRIIENEIIRFSARFTRINTINIEQRHIYVYIQLIRRIFLLLAREIYSLREIFEKLLLLLRR